MFYLAIAAKLLQQIKCCRIAECWTKHTVNQWLDCHHWLYLKLSFTSLNFVLIPIRYINTIMSIAKKCKLHHHISEWHIKQDYKCYSSTNYFCRPKDLECPAGRCYVFPVWIHLLPPTQNTAFQEVFSGHYHPILTACWLLAQACLFQLWDSFAILRSTIINFQFCWSAKQASFTLHYTILFTDLHASCTFNHCLQCFYRLFQITSAVHPTSNQPETLHLVQFPYVPHGVRKQSALYTEWNAGLTPLDERTAD